jgi:predicted nuclease of predicted toxin-antitoxin system
MRPLLFDQNLSPRLVDRLADLYPGSIHSTAEIEELLRENCEAIQAVADDPNTGILMLF